MQNLFLLTSLTNISSVPVSMTHIILGIYKVKESILRGFRRGLNVMVFSTCVIFRHGNGAGRDGDGSCLPQTHIVRVFPKLITILSGDKKYNPKPKPNGDRVSRRGSGIPVIPLPT
jgi:hypothetical protein